MVSLRLSVLLSLLAGSAAGQSSLVAPAQPLAPPRAAAGAPATPPVIAPPAAPPAVRPPPRPVAPAAAPPPRPAAKPPTATATPRPRSAPGAAVTAPVVAAPPAPPPPPPAPTIGSATGLPLPRHAALGSNLVNLRVGPDLRYPIDWTFQRRDLPVLIIDEHQQWRRIRDPDGTEGWVQRPLLTSRRSFVVRSPEAPLRRRAEADAAPVAVLKAGVVGRIRTCAAGSAWCEAQVAGHRGFVQRAEIWGVTGEEAVN